MKKHNLKYKILRLIKNLVDNFIYKERYIYKITNQINKKIYIGKCSLPINKSKYYYGSGKIILNAINKYGIKNFTKEILEAGYMTVKDINKKEIYWIKSYNSTNKEIGYNITPGGEGGYVINYGTKQPKSCPWKNKKQPKSMTDKRSKSLKGRASPMKNRHQSKKARQLISKNNAKYWSGKKMHKNAKIALAKVRKNQDMRFRFASYKLINPQGNIYIINNSVKYFLKEYHL
jgi:group I intron endonuclease